MFCTDPQLATAVLHAEEIQRLQAEHDEQIAELKAMNSKLVEENATLKQVCGQVEPGPEPEPEPAAA